MGKAPRTIAALPLSAVMFVEVTYDYQPIISNKLVGHTRIRYESAFTVRDRADLGITNVPAIPVNSC